MKTLFTQAHFNTAKNTTKLPLKCYYCSNTFQQEKRHIKYEKKRNRGRLKYCSTTCAGKAQRSPKRHTTLICATCNISYSKLTKDIKKSKSGKHFCSIKCSSIHQRKDPNIPSTKSIKTCLICGKPTATKSSKYCIDHRGNKIYRENLKKKTDNIKLKEIKERVNYDSQRMHIQIRAHCRKRNKNLQSNSCARCEYSYHVQLCHIKPVSSFPDSATLGEINDPSNIVTLCPNCHWEYDNGYLKL